LENVPRPIVSGGYLLARGYVSKDGFSSALRQPLNRKVMKVVVTAYTSSPEETDSTPHITASGSYAQYGVAAANFLAIGTKIRIPEHFGGQIFVIEDRLNSRYNDRVDIWLPAKEDARNFGVQVSDVEIF
jgi:3D (Asp-Asp-Asp) domain-containing protein